MFKKIVTPFIFLSILFLSLAVSAQKKQTVTVIKNNGETLQLETTLKSYWGEYIFPDDSNSCIKGKVDGTKTKILKASIQSIRLANGSEYVLLKDENGQYTNDLTYRHRYHVGFYITQGKVNIFKCYSYGRSQMPSSSLGGGGQLSANKTASATYYEIVNNSIDSAIEYKERRNFLTKWRARCASFRTYIKDKKRVLKDENFEAAAKFYNEKCE